jgi:hypothetical protein
MTDHAEPGPPDEVGMDRGHAETARQLEDDNPDWIVVFGVYSRQFVAFPRFPAPPRTILVATYPAALPPRMRAVERRLHIGTPHRRKVPPGGG